MAKASSQKFIARNRAPRVQIEYDVEVYGAEKKVQLPFVMGVMADLSGKSEVEKPQVSERKALEVDVDNFDERMKAIKPRVAFTVPNTLTGVVLDEFDPFPSSPFPPAPQHLIVLSDSKAQLDPLLFKTTSIPSDIEVALEIPDTLTGVFLSVLDPSPSWPF